MTYQRINTANFLKFKTKNYSFNINLKKKFTFIFTYEPPIKLADKSSPPNVFRYQTLISILLSSQTKDQVKYYLFIKN